MPAQASAPAQAPVAAKTKEEAIARSKNVSSQQQAPQKAAPQAAAATPQADRTPAPPKKRAAPPDPKELERRREGGERSHSGRPVSRVAEGNRYVSQTSVLQFGPHSLAGGVFLRSAFKSPVYIHPEKTFSQNSCDTNAIEVQPMPIHFHSLNGNDEYRHASVEPDASLA